jgi:DNA integrity scanning protein DisA with diadenylate cyclase activity
MIVACFVWLGVEAVAFGDYVEVVRLHATSTSAGYASRHLAALHIRRSTAAARYGA